MKQTGCSATKRRALVIFGSVIAGCLFVNGLSYFVLSDGHGVYRVADGYNRFGFPFIMFEKGGYSGRNAFCSKAALANALCGVGLASAVTCLWYLMRRAEAVSDKDQTLER